MRTGAWVCVFLVLLTLVGGCERKKDWRAWTELHYAADRGDVAEVQRLLARGTHVNAQDKEGRTPLHLAAEGGHEIVVALLVRCGARMDATDNAGRTPVVLAMEGNGRPVVEQLLAYGAALTLHIAAYLGDVEKARVLLDAGADVNAQDRRGRTPLHIAVRKDDMKMVQLLVARKAGLNNRDGKASTPLCDALERKHWAMAEWLISNGADVNVEPLHREPPLSGAAGNGRTDIVRLLLAKGADVNARGSCALRRAAAEGYREIVELLLAAGVDVNATEDGGWTALMEAASRGHTEIAAMLLAAGADVAAEGSQYYEERLTTALHEAAGRAHKETVALLLAAGAGVRMKDGGGRTPLHEVVGAYRWSSVLELAHDLSVDFGETNEDPCEAGERRAHDAERTETLSLLLTHPTCADAAARHGGTLLAAAAGSGYKEAVKMLLARGTAIDGKTVDPNAPRGLSPLLTALHEGYVNIAGLLIDRGADVNAQDHAGRTPLVYALQEGSTSDDSPFAPGGIRRMSYDGTWFIRDEQERVFIAALRTGYRNVVTSLLSRGAFASPRDDEGNTPLHVAVSNRDEELTRLLIECDAMLDAKDKTGATPLHHAARGDKRMAELLVAAGASVNVVSNDGDTPLHEAAFRGQRETVQLLLAHGADANVRNSRGRTPLDEALRRGHRDIVQLLKAKSSGPAATGEGRDDSAK